MNFYIAQFFGFIGLILLVASYQVKVKRKLITLQICANLFYGVQYLLLNAVSGLMIMGLFGGTIFPLAMGYAADMVGQNGSVAVMAVGAIFLMVYTFMIKKSSK